MYNIYDLVKNADAAIEDLLSCAEQVKLDGNVFVLKMDGERNEMQYTCFITFPESRNQMIRKDGDEMKKVLVDVFVDYLKIYRQ